MLYYILRKTVWKNDTPKQRKFLYCTRKEVHIVNYLSRFMYICFCMGFLSSEIVLLHNMILSNKKFIIFLIFFLLQYSFILFFATYFKQETKVFLSFISMKLFYNLITKRGKAISKNDFELIKTENETLYTYISELQCLENCYPVSCNLLKTLKKGHIEFISVINVFNEAKEETKPFANTIHAIYVNNGWCFDTYSHKQYKIKDFYKIFEAKLWKKFEYSDIENVDYNKILIPYVNEFAHWCRENNVYETWSKKLV